MSRGMKSRFQGRIALTAGAVLVTTAVHASVPVQAPAQTLCVLDFQRLGHDSRSDWLEQGLADLMIGTMSALGPYLVVERRHLREILREHGLTESGLVDLQTAARTARLVKADLLLQGSFARQGEDLVIQVRLIRVSDQRVLGFAAWTDRYGNLLAAPRALSEQLLGNLVRPPGKYVSLETLIPPAIDVARSYYQGLRAFDNGQYHEALAHYLDAAHAPGAFRKAQAAVTEMYYLLGRSDHAVLFARDVARSLEAARDVPGALEYYFAAARECVGPLNDQRSGRDLLQTLLRLVDRHERRTREIAGTRRFILDRLAELQRADGSGDPRTALADRDIRHRIWLGDIDAELARRAEEQSRGGFAVLENGTWVKRSVPAPSLLMWKIRSLSELARIHARMGAIRAALDRYRDLLEEYAFLAPYLSGDDRLLTSIRTEAHFMVLHHYARTGTLIRDHALNRINGLNVVSNRHAFTRDLLDSRPDARARVASRHEGRAYEYFDFAAPPGYRIAAVTLRATVDGIAEFRFDRPHPAGWPPQYSLSRRFASFKFVRQGDYERTVVPAAGTEFMSIGTSWGPGLFSNTPTDVEHWKRYPPRNGRDLVRWSATFTLSPMRPNREAPGTPADASRIASIRSLAGRYAVGWEQVSVVRAGETSVYGGNPRLDVYAEDWLVYSLEGDIRIFHQRNPRLEVTLPLTINSREREFDASLVRTHDGRYALLWARGSSRTNASRFVAFSADLLRWELPQRLVFEEPGSVRYTYGRAEPLERTYNVAAVPRGYVMLLAQGFVRVSADLRTWGPPHQALPQDLGRNRLIRSRDGTIWAVYESTSPERQAYTPADWLHGSFVVDGRQYRHVTELRVSRTVDGLAWEPVGSLSFPGQPSALWAFTVDDQRIGIALGFNNLTMNWLTASRFEDLRTTDLELPLVHQSDEAEWFVRDAALTCVRPFLDPDSQRSMLLATSRPWHWETRAKP
jgi:TolB-like protein